MVQFAPAHRAIPFIRRFYDELMVDGEPRLSDPVNTDGSLWIECTIDGSTCGGFLLIPNCGAYEVVTLLIPPARGATAVGLAKEALALFHSQHPHGKLFACTYTGMRAAQRFISAVGFTRREQKDEGASRSGVPCQAIYYDHG